MYLFFSWQTCGCFHFLAVMNNPVMNIHIRALDMLHFCWVFAEGWTATSSDDTFMFNEVWGLARLFQSGCAIRHSYHQCPSIQISPHPCQHLLLLPVLMYPTWQVWTVSHVSIWDTLSTLHFLKYIHFIKVQWTFNASGAQQGDSVIHIHMYCFWNYFPL